jgi:hypothetical protein
MPLSETTPQNLKNHARVDPLYHYVLGGLLFVAFVHSVMIVVHHPDPVSLTLLVTTFALLIMCYKLRAYPLRVQDRVIRLEERLRLMTILPPLLHHRIAELSVSQLVALRFASDKELMALTARVLEEKLDARQIKAAIVEWRPDYFRL